MTLLASAARQSNSDLSQKFVDRMQELFPSLEKGLTSASILLANVYASLGEMNKTSAIRTRLSQLGSRKEVGLSWTEVNGQLVVSFVSIVINPRLMILVY